MQGNIFNLRKDLSLHTHIEPWLYIRPILCPPWKKNPPHVGMNSLYKDKKYEKFRHVYAFHYC